jgi:hypothetical protein
VSRGGGLATLLGMVLLSTTVVSDSAQAKCLPGATDVPALESIAMPEHFVPGQAAEMILRARLDSVRGEEDHCELIRGCPLDDGRVRVLAEPMPNSVGDSNRLVFPAEPTDEPGVYLANVTLPYDARWWLRVSVGRGIAEPVIPLDEARERAIPVTRYATVPAAAPAPRLMSFTSVS